MRSAVNEKMRAVLDWIFIVAGLGQFGFYVYLGWLGVSLSADAIPAVFILFIIVGALVGRRLGRYGRPRVLVFTLVGATVGFMFPSLWSWMPALGAICGAAYGWAEAREVAADQSDMDNGDERRQN